MKLSEYIKELQKLYKEHGDLELYYSIDEEGNAFFKSYSEPQIMYRPKRTEGEHSFNDDYYFEEDFYEGEELIKEQLHKIILIN